MSHRIDVKYTIPDTRAEVKLRYFKSLGTAIPISKVELVDSYVTDVRLSPREIKEVAQMLANPIVETASTYGPLYPKKFDWAFEIGFLPGVTDNAGSTARESISDKLGKKLKNGEGVYTSQVFYLTGKLTTYEVGKIAESLYNPLIQRAKILSYKDFIKSKGFGSSVPKVKLSAKQNVTLVDLKLPQEELIALGKFGIKNPDGSRSGPLALPLPYLKAIKQHFYKLGRKPTDVELETLAQTWSEHCKHTIFRSPIDNIKKGLFKTYIKGATDKIREARGKKDFCVSVFDDNAGAIIFDKDHIISHKVETHNTPSALDPFGGAITGIVGVNRACLGFGLGGKPIINTYGFCFAPTPEFQRHAGTSRGSDRSVGAELVLYRDKNLTQKMLPARRVMEGVVAGINAGGNCSGIPTPQGFVFFDERYIGKPSVFAGTVGLLPKYAGKKLSHVKAAKPGDYIVMIGGRVGQDGIHGATFSSVALDEGSPATAVQIGDPITQKKLSDAIVKEARDKNLFNSITDCGAGGLSSAVGEMAR